MNGYFCDIDSHEPDCADRCDHDWRSPHEVLGGLKENPGVWGHGGGVVVREVCAHCGCYRITDTSEHHTSYDDADEKSQEWVAALRSDND